MLSEQITLDFHGSTVQLLKEKAVFFPDRQILALADVHLGKLEHFRKNGMAVPTPQTDFSNLSQLIDKYRPSQLIFLGDLFHSEENTSILRFKAWRQQFSTTDILLISGNHDVLTNFAGLGLEVTEHLDIGNIRLKHAPDDTSDQPTIAGHIHPGIRLKGMGRQSLKLPCFYMHRHQMIIPAFGISTGLHLIQPERGSQLYAVTPSGLAYYSSEVKI
jgi:uncharacterized protein